MRSELLDAQLRLASVRGLGPVLTGRLQAAFGSPIDICRAGVSQLKQVEGIAGKRAADIRRELDAVDLDAQWGLIEAHGVTLLTIEDDGYPALLRHIPDPPPLLFVRGELEPEDSVSLAIVGSRRCTHYGREQADRMAAMGAQAGLTIISGGARGIDTAAHQAALRIGGRSIAVLGCGLAETYPPENHELYDAIADGRGAVISELPMTAPPLAENFPRRNRIISGLSLGVLVVEAAARSGALITARLAAEEHHREVMALPGRVDSPASVGCHRIIREGWAQLVTNGGDVLDALGEAGQTLKGALAEREPAGDEAGDGDDGDPVVAGLTDEQRQVFAAIGREPTLIDAVCHRTQLTAPAVQSHLTFLQLRGLVDRASGNQVRRRR